MPYFYRLMQNLGDILEKKDMEGSWCLYIHYGRVDQWSKMVFQLSVENSNPILKGIYYVFFLLR